jgi:hypothetical protein
MTKLAPPSGFVPYQKIRLDSGTVVRPDVQGRVTVDLQSDVDALTAEGWCIITVDRRLRSGDVLAKSRISGLDELKELLGADHPLVRKMAELEDTVADMRTRIIEIEQQPLTALLMKDVVTTNGAMHHGVDGIDFDGVLRALEQAQRDREMFNQLRGLR